MKVPALILVALSSFGAVAVPDDISNEVQGWLTSDASANAIMISTSTNMPMYYLLYQFEWWRITLEYHRRLNSLWEFQGLLSMTWYESPDSSWYMPAAGLSVVRYLRANKHGFYFGGLLLLDFVRCTLKEANQTAEAFSPALCAVIGYKHVFRSGFCINFSIAPGVKVYHSFIFPMYGTKGYAEREGPRFYGRDTVGAGWAF